MGGNNSKAAVKKKYAGANCRAAPDPGKFTGAGGDDTGVKSGKQVIDFHYGEEGNKAVIPLNTVITDAVEIKNNNSYAIKFSFEPCFQREFQLTFTPSKGTIKPRSAKVIKAKLNVHIKVNINFRVTLNIEGVGSHFIIAKIRCETGVFGVDPVSLPMKPDEQGRKIPDVLLVLKAAFMERDGLAQEGVFRLAGEQTELKTVKQKMNAGDMGMPADVNTVATLIKIWYRELPQPVLNALPSERIFYSGEVQDCVDAVATLPELQRNLLDWLLDFLLLVAENRRVNKMTAQNLAIVVAPNLYEATTPDPMEGLVMSQKAVQFIHNVLIAKIRARERALGHALDTEFGQEELAAQPLKPGAVSPRGPTAPFITEKSAPLIKATAPAPQQAQTESQEPASTGAGASAAVAAARSPDNAEHPAESNEGGHAREDSGDARRQKKHHKGGHKKKRSDAAAAEAPAQPETDAAQSADATPAQPAAAAPAEVAAL